MLLPLEGTWDPRLGMWGQGKRHTTTRGLMGSRAGEAGIGKEGSKAGGRQVGCSKEVTCGAKTNRN